MIRPAMMLVPLLLAGCSRDATVYPSLLPRAVEKQGFEEPDVKPAVAVAADPALDAKVVTTGEQLDQLSKAFAAQSLAAQSSARGAAGAAAGSEPWLAAQTALAQLDDLHAQVSALATNLEESAIERAATLAPDYPTLTALTARVDAENATEGETIARIGRTLAPA